MEKRKACIIREKHAETKIAQKGKKQAEGEKTSRRENYTEAEGKSMQKGKAQKMKTTHLKCRPHT